MSSKAGAQVGARIDFAFYGDFEGAGREARLSGGGRRGCARDLKKRTATRTSSSNGRGVHENDGRCAQDTLVSHLVRFHRQKCRRRICSFRHDAVAVDHPYCSPARKWFSNGPRRGAIAIRDPPGRNRRRISPTCGRTRASRLR